MKHFLPQLILTGLLLGQDTTLVLIDGSTVSGTIISETDSTYRIMGESWRVTDGVYEVFNTFINISKNETVEEKELSKQDVLLHKSGKNYKGTFLGKVDEKIIFKIEGEKSNSAFSINDVDIVITSRGGIKVELYYPFDIPTKKENPSFGQDLLIFKPGDFKKGVRPSFSSVAQFYLDNILYSAGCCLLGILVMYWAFESGAGM